ncbi:MAG: LysR family transcriptional regulator [Zoogloeaceae bacterium]|uniref:LysR family transcriptional regulator n=2 Tax=Denitromonas TaxID=139331 RepID=A0A558E676_9RHOO|nr:LysR family transcriptional regulator [Denitromonas ohlonensis]MCB1910936.1 LysR family transcriptional regulator [Rhodocyclaceae bacterium]MCP5223131.1 LysR family transcriptional regulator [Zoogloeaceae bacterium]TVT48712.1 MAG: LysR family transcriptional regulator [Denitromonas halophila]TVO59572.1 LysR family transcriptional regulator [Denitromonas ohlonensis]TVO71433.1 LysR family transcriptional regulator [Denitromonas ohlonensis]
MTVGIQPAELSFIATLASCGSLSAAARELGITTPAVSKRLAQMEARLGLPLVNRTTRRMSLTPEGEVFLEHARRILGDIADLDQLLTRSKGTPKGLLRVNATLGFGRLHIAPVISRYVSQYPDVDAQLQLSATPPPLTDDQFDVCIRFGAPPEARVIAKRLASNRRLLCASPKYLKAQGEPKIPNDLTHHNCIGIRQGDEAYGVWRLTPLRNPSRDAEAIKVRGNLTTNDGEIAVNWALDGHGILMRAEWDIERYLNSGRLVQVLPQYQTPDADIYAVYPLRHQLSIRIRTFIDFLSQSFVRFGEKSG